MTARRLSRELDRVASNVAGIAWPALTSPDRAPLLLLTERLERSQWLPAELLAKGQYAQLGVLARHAAAESPLFAARLKDAGLQPVDLVTPAGLAALPLLSRAALQTDPVRVDCAGLPEGHAPIAQNVSSGSTGEPVRIRRTAINALFWNAQTLRWHLWTGEDLSGRLAVVRANIPQIGKHPNWGMPVRAMRQTGPALAIDVTTDYDAIAEQLAAFDPHSLLTYPSVLGMLLDKLDAGTISLPSLKTVRLLGETLPDATYARATARFAVNSAYSTMEMGYLTLQCPVSGLHHIMSETAIVEIVGDDDRPVGEGQTGRVVATDIHNFKTPLIRYEIGDWAEVGPPCPCGRGLPTLSRIHGRTRNVMTMPNGSKRWALTGSIRYARDVPLRQMQLIQHSLDRLEARYTADAPLGADDAAALVAAIHDATDPAFRVDLTYAQGRLDNPKSGKFEEFVSRLS